MPYKSDAQRKFFHAAEERGDISPKVVDEFDKASKGKSLPEHAKKHESMAEGGVPEPEAPKPAEPMPDLESSAESFEHGMDKTHVQHDSDAVKSYLASKFHQLMHPGDETAKMSEGGYPHVTFLENVSTPEMKKTVHLEDPSGAHGAGIAAGHEENYAEGGTVHKAEDRSKEPARPADVSMPHEEQLNAIYRAMGMEKYAAGGPVVPGVPNFGAPNVPSQNDPTFWEQIKAALAQAGSKAAAPIMAPAGIAGNAAQAAMPAIEAGAPGAVSALNSVMGTNIPVPAAPAPKIEDLAGPTPLSEAAPAPMPRPAAPAAPKMPQNAAQPDNLRDIFSQDTSKLTEGVEASDRQNLADKMSERQTGMGSIVGQALAGLGDALAAKGGREQHSLKDIFALHKQQRDEALSNFDKARQDRLEKLDLQTKMGDNAIKKLAAQDAYGVDEHLNKMLGAPAGTAHKDLPLYVQMATAQVAQQEKDADLYMKAHSQAADEVENAEKNAGMFHIKLSPEQKKAAGAKIADQYYNRAKGNVFFKSSDGQSVWIPAKNAEAAKKMDPNGQIVP